MSGRFQVSHGQLTNVDDHSQFRYAKVRFSDCGSFCFLDLYPSGVLMLSSIFLERRQAKVQTPAVWGSGTSVNGRIYNVGWLRDPKKVKLYQTIRLPCRTDYRDFGYSRYYQKHEIVVDITALPTHLAFPKVHLLAGKKEDDHVRMLLLPKNGPPEIKYLHVTLSEVFAALDKAARAVEKLDIEEYNQQHYYDILEKEISVEEGGDITEEESSILESEDAAISVEEDGWESYESD